MKAAFQEFVQYTQELIRDGWEHRKYILYGAVYTLPVIALAFIVRLLRGLCS